MLPRSTLGRLGSLPCWEDDTSLLLSLPVAANGSPLAAVALAVRIVDAVPPCVVMVLMMAGITDHELHGAKPSELLRVPDLDVTLRPMEAAFNDEPSCAAFHGIRDSPSSFKPPPLDEIFRVYSCRLLFKIQFQFKCRNDIYQVAVA